MGTDLPTAAAAGAGAAVSGGVRIVAAARNANVLR
jgi:hypothetical protein